MKTLSPEDLQSLIEKANKLASVDHGPTPDMFDLLASDNAQGYRYYKRLSVVRSDEEVESEMRKDRETTVILYLDRVECQNPLWDYEHGSNVNDCFYFLAMVKFADLLLEICFCTTVNREVNQQNTHNDISILNDTLVDNLITDTQKKQYIQNILAPLSGINSQMKNIMSKTDFERLISYTECLVLTEKLPERIESISQTNISNEHIRYTFYRLHKKTFGTSRIKLSFIDFLHAVFGQFAGTTSTTTKSKFSVAPKSYEKDFAGYIGEVA